ncbi:hypothetical protein EDD15DRAFT_2201311 [Pisolithus albus]|nr:hypothetical protein EDD15DRAFT_2201311 [Pisolithus albus]
MEELMTVIGSPAGVPWKRDNAASTQMRKLFMWWRVASSTIGVGFVSDPENIVLVPGLVFLVGLEISFAMYNVRKGKPAATEGSQLQAQTTRATGYYSESLSNAGWVGYREQRTFTAYEFIVVLPEQGADILELCRGVQELTLQTTANQPDDENPLRGPLCALRPTTLSMDLASAFYRPTVFLPVLPLLCCIERLHLMNSWVARRGLHIGLQELLLSEILRCFTRLQVVVLWQMEYQDCRETYTDLERHNFLDHRIVVFNTAHFAEHAGPGNSFWEVAKHVVQWREDNREQWLFGIPSNISESYLDLLSVSYECMVFQGSCQSRVRARCIFLEKLLTADIVFPTTSQFMLLNNCTRETCNAGRAAAFAVLTMTLVYRWKVESFPETFFTIQDFSTLKQNSHPGPGLLQATVLQTVKSSHFATSRPVTTMPKANPAPHLSIRRKISGRADTVIERMAKHNALYLQMFDQHADLVRGKDTEEVMNAYHRVMSRGIPSDSSLITDGELDTMEQILCSPTATLDEYTSHVFVSLTAHSLLLSQLETMKKLPYDVMVKVDPLTIDLRSQERDRKCTSPQDNLQYEDISFPSEDVTMREMEERLTNSYMTCGNSGTKQDFLKCMNG